MAIVVTRAPPEPKPVPVPPVAVPPLLATPVVGVGEGDDPGDGGDVVGGGLVTTYAVAGGPPVNLIVAEKVW